MLPDDCDMESNLKLRTVVLIPWRLRPEQSQEMMQTNHAFFLDCTTTELDSNQCIMIYPDSSTKTQRRRLVGRRVLNISVDATGD
jgi:hypothetical protein